MASGLCGKLGVDVLRPVTMAHDPDNESVTTQFPSVMVHLVQVQTHRSKIATMRNHVSISF